MPLEAPKLDRRNFDEIFRDARLRIPRYTPEWTDFNESDPGIALLQLHAWLTEMMLYEMNRVPERNYIKFLQLLNMELQPAQPATAHLTFTARAGATVAPVRQGTQVSAQPPDGGSPLIFETESGLSLVRMPLVDVQVYDGRDFTRVSVNNEIPGTTYRPFGWQPQLGSALYLGFEPLESTLPAGERLFPQEIRLRVFLPSIAQAGVAQSCREAQKPPAPPIGLELVWEYKVKASDSRWQRLDVFRDDTTAFTREGYLSLAGPREMEPTSVGKVTEPRYWLRCRLAGGNYPSHRIPVIDFVRPNVVEARNLATVREEVIGISEGVPDQVFSLRNRPVLAGTLVLHVEQEGQLLADEQPWRLVEDFLDSGPEDAHYLLNHNKGEIRFGNGRNGRVPSAGAQLVARIYRYGGGSAGNLGAHMISTPLSSVVGLDSVTNERPAVGGCDEQDVDELKAQAPRELRSRNRAVTQEDFAALAVRVGGVYKATAVALAHPAFPGIDVPGAVTVVIVPDSDAMPPLPTGDEIRAVCSYLDDYRLLTTEVYVKGPDYRAIRVEARVTAQAYAAFDAVTQDVIAAINNYLDPRQWPFGRDFFPINLYGVILGVAGVETVANLAIRVNGRPHNEDLTRPVILPPDGLVCGVDNHEIVVVPHRDL